MALETPDWLKQRGCGFKKADIGAGWFVFFGDRPEYLLIPVPVRGKYGCKIEQVTNGKLLESTATGSTVDEALRQGLEDLRKALGW